MIRKKYCLAPFPVLWDRLDARGLAREFLGAMNETEDSPVARRRAYDAYATHLRDGGRLCDHPDHQPAHFRVQ